MDNDMVTVKEAARILGVTRQGVHYHLKHSGVEHRRMAGPVEYYVLNLEQLREAMQRQQEA
jgi:predicted transcriptional regulator